MLNNMQFFIFNMDSNTAIKIISFLLILLAVSLEIIADIIFKKWSIDNKNLLLYIGLLIYFIGTIFWAFSLKYEYLSRAISVFTVLNLLIVALVGIIYFKEDLSFINKIGIGLSVLAIILVEI